MIEPNNIYNGDCLDVMKDIPDNSIDCVICDLPYGTTEAYWDSIIPLDKLWEQYLRITKETAPILLFGAEPFSTVLRMSMLDLFRYDLIWVKNKVTNYLEAKNRPMRRHEKISVFSKSKFSNGCKTKMTYNPQGLIRCDIKVHNGDSNIYGKRKCRANTTYHKQEFTNYPSDVLYFNSDTSKLHPTAKPIDLLRYLILTYSNQNDIILDNTMGSGTTCVAAIKEKRRYIGIEKDEKYFRIANKRIEQEKMQLNLF